MKYMYQRNIKKSQQQTQPPSQTPIQITMGTFDSFKREAIQLERQLEDKVGRFQQLAQTYSTNCANGSVVVPSSDPLSRAEQGGGGIGNPNHELLSNYQNEIPVLIKQLSNLLLKVHPTTPSQRATLQRYKDIHADVQNDYDKANLLYRRALERNELLSGGSAGAQDGDGQQQDPGMDRLLRERNHIMNSMNAATNVIGQAESIHYDLSTQGRSLRSTTNKMIQIAGNIPGINTLVDAIRKKRNQDEKVVAAVIAGCIVFTLWYMFG